MIPDEVIPANVKSAAIIPFMYNEGFYKDSQYAMSFVFIKVHFQRLYWLFAFIKVRFRSLLEKSMKRYKRT